MKIEPEEVFSLDEMKVEGTWLLSNCPGQNTARISKKRFLFSRKLSVEHRYLYSLEDRTGSYISILHPSTIVWVCHNVSSPAQEAS